MGRKRLRIDAMAPLPEGLYLHGRQFRARRPGNEWAYFGTERGAALHAYTRWLQRTATMQTDVDRVVAIKLKQRDKKLMQARAITREIDPKRL